jgi:Do/DeqQ family serine protease
MWWRDAMQLPRSHRAGISMRRLWLIFSQAATVAMAVLFVVATLKPEWLRGANAPTSVARPAAGAPQPPDPPTSATPPQARVQAASVSAPAASPPGLPGTSLAVAARRAAPAVVTIAASKAPMRQDRLDDPWLRFLFGRGQPQRPPSRAQVGLGSGVIVSEQGFLLTNNHVVESADDIEVQLADGRGATARIVGTDIETDLAVLKIELDNLPVIDFGNTQELQVGDAVLAIGNPFGVGQTVTSGIVSALGRTRLGINTFENFIQTDAAINPGNSGGALVDAQGRLVGINTAIFSRSGGSLGIGFAIPAGTARKVMDSLVRDGSVTRGWIGVESRDLTTDLAASLGLKVVQGVLITGVMRDGPAARGGVRPGDVVTRVDARTVSNSTDLLEAVAALEPQSRAELSIQRGPRAVSVSVEVDKRQTPRRRPE